MRALLLTAVLSSSALMGADGRVIKVLPQLLDNQGRHSLSPSLYERDAYQALLRKELARAHGIRFDVLWKAAKVHDGPLRLRVEMRGSKDAAYTTVEREAKPGFLGRCWTRFVIDDEQFRRLGPASAWRVTLYHGDRQIDEMRSFLW